MSRLALAAPLLGEGLLMGFDKREYYFLVPFVIFISCLVLLGVFF